MNSDLIWASDLAVAYLKAMEARDIQAARALVADGAMEIVFPGGRRFSGIDEIIRNSSGRYRVVRKHIENRDAWRSDGCVRVMITGTLYGQWPDGTAFEDIRFVDWFEIEEAPPARILRQHVWNDSGERLVAMHGDAKG